MPSHHIVTPTIPLVSLPYTTEKFLWGPSSLPTSLSPVPCLLWLWNTPLHLYTHIFSAWNIWPPVFPGYLLLPLSQPECQPWVWPLVAITLLEFSAEQKLQFLIALFCIACPCLSLGHMLWGSTGLTLFWVTHHCIPHIRTIPKTS